MNIQLVIQILMHKTIMEKLNFLYELHNLNHVLIVD